MGAAPEGCRFQLGSLMIRITWKHQSTSSPGAMRAVALAEVQIGRRPLEPAFLQSWPREQ